MVRSHGHDRYQALSTLQMVNASLAGDGALDEDEYVEVCAYYGVPMESAKLCFQHFSKGKTVRLQLVLKCTVLHCRWIAPTSANYGFNT